MRGRPSRSVKHKQILRIAERRQTSDEIRRHNLEHDRVFDVEIRKAARDNRERNDDEQCDVVRHQRCDDTAHEHECQRESAGRAEAQECRIHRQIETAGRAKNLDRRQQREQHEEKIDIDRLRRPPRSDAASEDEDCGENTRCERQPMTTRERQHTPSLIGGAA